MSLYLAEGTHLLADFSGVRPEILTSCTDIESLLRSAALAAGAQILHSHFHPFGLGLGITGVVLLAESHISIHTWPEQQFAAVDIFMCGNTEPDRALAMIRAALEPAQCRVRTIQRSVSESQDADIAMALRA